MPPAVRPPLAVLFACSRNAVRSPMAAALFTQVFGRSVYVGSAGVRKGELDAFAVAAMAEVGLDISRHKPMTLEELEEWEGLNFDLIVTLAPEAHHRALELTRTSARWCASGASVTIRSKFSPSHSSSSSSVMGLWREMSKPISVMAETAKGSSSPLWTPAEPT